MVKGVKKAIPEREIFLEHLARKLAVLVETEPVLLEKLSENGQLDLLYDMGATSGPLFLLRWK